jgi:hypothetical protein
LPIMAWLPILKTVLPYLGPVVQAALPHLTRKKSERADPLVAEQITELQDAVNRSAESIKALAAAMEASAKANDAAIRRARVLSIAALAVAGISALVAVLAWL